MLEKVTMTKEDIKKAKDIIREYELSAEIIDYSEVSPETSLKFSCVVADGKPMIVMTSGGVMFDMDKLKRANSLQKVKMAGEKEIQELFGKSCEDMNILTIPSNIRLCADTQLFEKEWVVGTSGSPHSGLKINPKEILKVQNIFITELATGF